MSQGNATAVSNAIRPCLLPIMALVGTSYNYAQQTSATFHLGTDYIGQQFNRSNGGVAMTDSLPAPAVTFGDQAALPNGWNIYVNNIDATAAITLTPASPTTINGVATLVIPAGSSVFISTDGNNYFSRSASQVGGTAIAPVTAVTGSPIALGTYASGSIIERSNSTTAMSDTLPNANTLPNGWWIEVFNIDASASDTITPATSTINGASTLVIASGKSSIIRGDGTNYRATTPN
jgi:hypothetical protein